VSTLEISLLIALAAQIPLIGLAIVTAFSQRKRQPSRQAGTSAARPTAERPTAGPAVIEERAEAPASFEHRTPEPSPAPELATEPPPAAAEPAAAPAEAPIATPEITEPPRETPEEPPAVVFAPPAAPEVEVPKAIVPVPSTEAFEPAPVVVESEPAPPPEPPAAPSPEPVREPVRIGLGLRKTRENFIARIRAAITGSARADEIYEGLEEALIGADAGVETSLKIVEAVRAKLKNDARPEVIQKALQEEIERILIAAERPLVEINDAPLVIMMAGVNGAGKTTTVAKLADLFKRERGTVIVAAADTFRAAAIEQLQVWCDRVGVELIKQKQGSDPAAVAFDAVKAAVARKASAVLIDTAGRLQTKVNLMEELKKVARVVGRELPGAPHETWLVLDANTGQNALSQAKQFGEAVPLTGVILAKLDSTAKGGVIIGIAERLKLPVRFVGLGENLEDLRPFDAREFAAALFAESDQSAAKSAAA
jgi:fused signal recognition particle receptor